MAIEALSFPKFNNIAQASFIRPVTPVTAVASNPYEKALQNAGFKFNENPSLLSNPQASMCYLA
ncbi:MAG: hypothetical protein WCF95_00795 [bacterium]